MAIKFNCPHCKKALSVKDDSLAGKKAHCPNCRKVLVVPGPVSALAPAATTGGGFPEGQAGPGKEVPSPPSEVPTASHAAPFDSGEAPTIAPRPTSDGGAAAPPAPAEVAGLVPELAGHLRYRLLRQLGQGGMGAVYLAEHLIMGRHVALKFVHAGLVASAGGLARFRQEVRAAARLSHENIVTAYDADEANGIHFLVMEFIEGVTLADTVALRGALPVAEACDYVRQAALGLQHAHEKGMVHRDIKPQNLMLTPAGRVKVLDFGLARFAREQGGGADGAITGSGVVMGTADYIAPEQTRSGRAVDIRADIYSLGCTLYFLLAGRVPFPDGTVIDKMIHQAMDDPPPLASVRPGVPGKLCAIVARMMAKDPEKRHPTPGDVARALTAFQAANPKDAGPPVLEFAEEDEREAAPAGQAPSRRTERTERLTREEGLREGRGRPAPPRRDKRAERAPGALGLGLASFVLGILALLGALGVTGCCPVSFRWLPIPVWGIGLILGFTGAFIPLVMKRPGLLWPILGVAVNVASAAILLLCYATGFDAYLDLCPSCGSRYGWA